ncbi:MAG: rod shape-determining protein MreD [Actinobacteria bacterium]|nr:rod shape-determining protein MreD [Actinomycetota bacterium]
MTPIDVAARWLVAIAIVFVLQVGLMPHIRPLGVVPDLLVVLAVCAGLSGGAQRGAAVGFWIGVVFDAVRPHHAVGVSALAYSLAAFAAGMAQVAMLQSARLISMLIVGVGSVVGVLLYATGAQMFGQDTLSNPDLLTILVVTALTGVVFSRPGLRMAGWADGPETRSVAE